MFEKIGIDKLLEEFKGTKKVKEVPVDFTEQNGKVIVYLRQLRYNDLVNKYRLMGKLEKIVGTIGIGKSVQKEEKIEIPEEVKKTKAKKVLNLLENMGISKEELEKEKEKKEIREEIIKEEVGKEKEGHVSLVEELVKEDLKEEVGKEVLIEDEETYSKVKEGVGISFIDNHKKPEILFNCEGAVEKDKNIGEEIYNNYISTKRVSKADLSKKLVDLTRQFLKAQTRDERERIKQEIVEVKQALRSKEEKKKIEPFELLKSIHESNMSKILNKVEEDFVYAINREKERYEQALSLNPSQKDRERIEELKEEDLRYIEEELEKTINNCISLMKEKCSKETKFLEEKIKKEFKGKGEMEKSIEERFKEIEEKIKAKIEELRGKKETFKEMEMKEEVEVEKGEKERKIDIVEELLKEINSMGDSSWLHYLGTKNRRLFWKYVRGEMNKEDALKKAKELYLKEKEKEHNLREEDLERLRKELYK